MFKLKLLVTGEPVFLESQRELVLFRIVQEALNNIVKHAAARAISIFLHYNEELMSLNITDDGKGFANGKSAEAGMGLANMKRRAGLLQGNFVINSQPGIGTEINIKIPLYEN